MNWNLLSEKFQTWISQVKEATLSREEIMASGREEWFAGLAVTPAAFSDQLASMQVSLERASVTEAQRVTADAPLEAVRQEA